MVLRGKTNLQLIISRKPKLRAIPQLVSAPLIPRQQLENNLGGATHLSELSYRTNVSMGKEMNGEP